MHNGRESTPAEALSRLGLMAIAVLAVYAPALSAGFLNYDDPWLFTGNPFLAPDAWHTPRAALFDFSKSTRMALGAEYLPVRDLFVWIETRLFGMYAPALHGVSVALYALAVALVRGALIRCFGASPWTELAALCFALHPVHAESVAWLAGQKDVIALVFVGGALYAHAGSAPRRRWLVPLLVLLASLSKSMSVAVVGLLLAQDLVLVRRPDLRMYAGVAAVVAATLACHVYVGRLVGMEAEPLGGSRYTALISMGPVWLRYAELSVWPSHLSIAHDVVERSCWDAAAMLGNLALLVALLGSLLALKYGSRRPAFATLWFLAPLAPVSQVLVPLQNRMADRYLWLSVLAPCLLLGWALEAASERASRRLGRVALHLLGGVAALALGALTLERSALFSDSVLVFADATAKTRLDTDAPYQLGKALEEQGRDDEAIGAFREVLARSPSGPEPDARAASNNLARLLARQGRLVEAEQVLRRALARFPGDPKVTNNLVKILRGLQRFQEAEALLKQAP